MPIYEYEHPETGEIFREIRKVKERDNPFISKDGKICKRITFPGGIKGWKKNREVFEADPAYVKQSNPKFVQFQDGHKERYDSTKHC
jgi:hypothetical protein